MTGSRAVVHYLFVSHCPIEEGCHWASDPLADENHARESLRAHLAGHTHAELVALAEKSPFTMATYNRQ